MRKTSTLLCIFFMLLMANMSFAENTTKSRRVYCVAQNNPDFSYKHGIAVFNTGTPADMQLLYQWSADYSIYAGAAANDTYYAYFYQFGSRGPEPVSFSSVNLRTGVEKEIVNWKDKGREFPKFQDMTYDYVSNQMYVLVFEYAPYLATINLTNGEINRVTQLERSLCTIAASNEGVLYGIDLNGRLCIIDKEDGTLETVITTEFSPTYLQSMEFDRTSGTLYWALSQSDPEGLRNDSYLIKFDLANKTYENLGHMGAPETQVMGMYIPFLKAGDDAPAAPDATATPAPQGAKSATITWKNPTKTFGNTDLLEITQLTLIRNDKDTLKVYDNVEDLVLGKEITFVDNTITKDGEYVYSIIATNTAGSGDPGKVDCFVGYDMPDAVQNLQTKVSTSCTGVNLTWEAPVKGEHDEYFDGTNLTYTLTRLPDGEVLLDNSKELTFTDENAGRLTGYIYKVTAANEGGVSKAVESEKIIIGEALAMPYSYDCIDEDEFKNTWQIYDQSDSEFINTFEIGGSAFAKAYFNDPQLTPAIEYMMQDEKEAVNEWLITPPIKFEKGKQKILTFGARNVGEDLLTVTLGTNNTVDGQTMELKTFTVKSQRLDAGDKNTHIDFTTFGVDLGEISGTYCIGFNLNTPSGSSVLFQLSNVYVGAPTAITNEQISDVNVFNLENTLCITGDFNKAEIYNASGVCVGHADASLSQVSTSNWTSGIYFVKVMSGEASKVFKTIIK